VSTREFDGRAVEFGTTGYTNNFVFVLYDRDTDSIWHPMSDGTFDAVAGTRKGTSLPFEAKPDPQPLSEWVAEHPDTTVMVPSERDAEFLNMMRTRPFLGVQLQDSDAGLEILGIVEGSGAADAGLAAGDIFVSLAGEPIANRGDLQVVMSGLSIGDAITVVVDRDGEEFTFEVALGSRL